MKLHIRLITTIGLAALGLSPCLTGCKKIEKPGGAENAGGEFSPAKLGLPPGAESLGPDELGRHWYKASDSDDPKWMYDPKDKTLYAASKDEKTGEWALKAKPEVTAASLGLAADTVELGKDSNGLYWFEVPGGEKRFTYNTKNKTLYHAQKDAAGKWDLGAPVKKP